MPRSRTVRAAGHTLRFLLFLVATFAALRFLAGSITTQGGGPAALFALLLVAGAASLTWRAYRDVRRSFHRIRG
jgi:hypothetical protein